MKRKLVLGVFVFLILIIFSCFANAQYNFLSEQSNWGIEHLKEKYHIKDKQNKEEIIVEGFIWGVIVPENEGYSFIEYTEMIEDKEYIITEIIIENPQGSIRIVWGPGAQNNPLDVPKIIVRR